MKDQRKVLVVEDDPAIAAILGRRLENLGYYVMRAGTAHRASELVNEADIVFLDLRLPDTSGEDWLHEIRNAGNYVPVVAMSAAVPRRVALERMEKFQIVDFMEKPFTSKEVEEKAWRASELADQLKFVGVAADRLKGFIERQNGKH